MNVYDFDNTIYRGESGVDLFLFFLKKDPSLLLKMPKAIKLIIKYKTNRISVDDMLENAGVEIMEYTSQIPNLEKEMEHFWDRHMNRIKPWYFRLRRPDDVILSAGPDMSLSVICNRLRIREFIGTAVDMDEKRITFLNFRENKVDAFERRFPNETIENFYTDSYNDQALIDIAQHAYMVKGNHVQQLK